MFDLESEEFWRRLARVWRKHNLRELTDEEIDTLPEGKPLSEAAIRQIVDKVLRGERIEQAFARITELTGNESREEVVDAALSLLARCLENDGWDGRVKIVGRVCASNPENTQIAFTVADPKPDYVPVHSLGSTHQELPPPDLDNPENYRFGS